MSRPKPVFTMPPDITERYVDPDQFAKFDAAVGKIMSVSPKHAESIRQKAAIHTNRRGRPKKEAASRVPGAEPPS